MTEQYFLEYEIGIKTAALQKCNDLLEEGICSNKSSICMIFKILLETEISYIEERLKKIKETCRSRASNINRFCNEHYQMGNETIYTCLLKCTKCDNAWMGTVFSSQSVIKCNECGEISKIEDAIITLDADVFMKTVDPGKLKIGTIEEEFQKTKDEMGV
jgi:hypothetical protein